MNTDNLYNYEFVEDLFDRMSASYERMNYVTSFGFSERWRVQCIQKARIKEGAVVADLMTGMGECWKPILKRCGKEGKLIALDFSQGMLNYARKRQAKREQHDIEILKENVFENSIKDNSVDAVISGFGIKTLSNEQLHLFAREIKRILKPEGKFSLIEVSVPKGKALRGMYMFYLKRIIPVLGRLFLGNPDTYKMLGVYTGKFTNATNTMEVFKQEGLEVEFNQYFYGCATGINGYILKR